MRKDKKRKISLILAFIMTFIFCTSTSFASETNELNASSFSGNEEQIYQLQIANMKVTNTDDGYECSFDLLQEVPIDSEDSARGIGWVTVGNGRFRLRIYTGNGLGDVAWNFTLTNGDVISGVKGTLIVEKDILGPINPNYAKIKIDEWYNTGTLFSNATGSEDFDMPESIDPDQNIIFRWSGFYITGLRGTYSAPNGNVQGKVREFT